MTDNSQKAITVQAQEAMVPLSVEIAVERHNLVVRFVEKLLVQDVDYGTIPGAGDKKTLLKPGAEKLAQFFGLTTEIQQTQALEDWEKRLFAYTYMATVRDRRSGQIVAQCEGSCNSMESKYRWRNIPEWEATDAVKQAAVSTSKRKGKGDKTYTFYRVPNDDIFSQLNTLRKMAQKRAIVGAVVVATGSSEFFKAEQEEIDAEWSEVPDGDTPPPAPAQQTTTTPAESIRARLTVAASKFIKTKAPSDAQLGLLAGKIAEALQDKDDKRRHLILRYLWEKESSRDLTLGQVGAMLNWLIIGADGQTNDYALNPKAVVELAIIDKAAQVSVGQTTLPLEEDELGQDLLVGLEVSA